MDDKLFDLIETGRQLSDGHFTLMAFTTHWKAMFFTPDLNTGKGREMINKIRPGNSPTEAVIIAVTDLLKKKGYDGL